MGCAVLIYENSNVRSSWNNHAVYVWYIYTSTEHYRTHVCRVKNTNSEQVSYTVVIQPKNITNQTITHADWVVKAIRNLKQLAKGMSNGKGENSMRDIKQLAAATDNLIKQHAPSANKTAPTEQFHIFTQKEAQVNTWTSPRVLIMESTPPLRTLADIPPYPRVPVMYTPSPRVHNAKPNTITILNINNANEYEPIVTCTRNCTKNPMPPLLTARTNDPAHNTR